MQQISQLVFCGLDVYQLDFEAISASYFWFLTGCYPEVLQRLVELGTDFTGAGRERLRSCMERVFRAQ